MVIPFCNLEAFGLSAASLPVGMVVGQLLGSVWSARKLAKSRELSKKEFDNERRNFAHAEEILQSAEQKLKAIKSDLNRGGELSSRKNLTKQLNATVRKVSSIRETFADVEEMVSCQICLGANRTIVFGCGHSTCHTCSTRVWDCPFCRKFISARIRIYQ